MFEMFIAFLLGGVIATGCNATPDEFFAYSLVVGSLYYLIDKACEFKVTRK